MLHFEYIYCWRHHNRRFRYLTLDWCKNTHVLTPIQSKYMYSHKCCGWCHLVCIFNRKDHLGVGGGTVWGPVGQNLTAGRLHLFCEFVHFSLWLVSVISCFPCRGATCREPAGVLNHVHLRILQQKDCVLEFGKIDATCQLAEAVLFLLGFYFKEALKC